MDTAEQDMNTRFWARCKQQVMNATAQGSEAVIRLAETLLSEWCIDGEQVQQIFALAVEQGELAAEILQCWEDRLRHRRDVALVLHHTGELACEMGLTEDANRPRAELSPSKRPAAAKARELPMILMRVAETIGNYTRKRGRLALEMGRELCGAREMCDQSQTSFPRFLAHLQKQYGLHAKTSYLYMQYWEWNFPDGLGSAVMKWIVGGFVRGSSEANRVISAAATEGLTLAELKSRHGIMRTCQKAAKDREQVSRSGTAPTIRQLESDKQRLLAARLEIDSRLAKIEATLQHLRDLALPAGKQVTSEGTGQPALNQEADA